MYAAGAMPKPAPLSVQHGAPVVDWRSILFAGLTIHPTLLQSCPILQSGTLYSSQSNGWNLFLPASKPSKNSLYYFFFFFNQSLDPLTSNPTLNQHLVPLVAPLSPCHNHPIPPHPTTGVSPPMHQPPIQRDWLIAHLPQPPKLIHSTTDYLIQQNDRKTIMLWLTLGSCWYCGRSLACNNITFDHVFPTSTYPTLRNHPQNLTPACRSCNSHKGNKNLGTYREYMSEVFDQPFYKFWGERVGLKLPLMQHYQPDDWRI